MLMPSIFGESLFDDFDNLMNFSFPDVDKTLYGKHAKNMMKTDVKEKDNGYEVAIDLPGFKKDELHLELNDGYLTISAEKGLDKDEKDKNDKYIRRERYAGSMSRSFYVGENIEGGRSSCEIRKRYPDLGRSERTEESCSGKTLHCN